MKISRTLLFAVAAVESATAFTASFPAAQRRQTISRTTTTTTTAVLAATMAEAGVPPAHSEPTSDVKDVEIPTNFPSECGMDYIPLATMLATGELAEADQVRVTS